MLRGIQRAYYKLRYDLNSILYMTNMYTSWSAYAFSRYRVAKRRAVRGIIYGKKLMRLGEIRGKSIDTTMHEYMKEQMNGLCELLKELCEREKELVE